jgi:catechol 2,3-dioxygenase
MQQTQQVFRPRLTHMGINVFDIAKMERFYTEVLGLIVTDRGRGKTFKMDLVFMSADPGTHHQIVLAGCRDPESKNSTVNQISFRLDSLEQLREMYHRVRDYGVKKLMPLDHGVAWSVYFLDPEDNTVELYVDSPWYVAQPHGDPFDPDRPTDEIIAETEAMCRQDPKFMPIEEFQATMRSRLSGAR